MYCLIAEELFSFRSYMHIQSVHFRNKCSKKNEKDNKNSIKHDCNPRDIMLVQTSRKHLKKIT